MLSYDLDKMLYTLPADKHSPEDIRAVLEKHPEVKFVSLVGIDIGGHDTDAVSYTHLDVYKRQRYGHGRSFDRRKS